MVLGIEVFPWYGMQKQQALMHWAKIARDAYLWQTWENNRRTGTEGGEMPADEEWPDGDQWLDGRETMAAEYARACKAISILNAT
jgi:hypothetical protein